MYLYVAQTVENPVIIGIGGGLLGGLVLCAIIWGILKEYNKCKQNKIARDKLKANAVANSAIKRSMNRSEVDNFSHHSAIGGSFRGLGGEGSKVVLNTPSGSFVLTAPPGFDEAVTNGSFKLTMSKGNVDSAGSIHRMNATNTGSYKMTTPKGSFVSMNKVDMNGSNTMMQGGMYNNNSSYPQQVYLNNVAGTSGFYSTSGSAGIAMPNNKGGSFVMNDGGSNISMSKGSFSMSKGSFTMNKMPPGFAPSSLPTPATGSLTTVTSLPPGLVMGAGVSGSNSISVVTPTPIKKGSFTAPNSDGSSTSIGSSHSAFVKIPSPTSANIQSPTSGIPSLGDVRINDSGSPRPLPPGIVPINRVENL